MNIAIAKFGRSIYFDRSRWGAIGGDNEPSLVYSHLAKAFPQHTFYLIGNSDYSKQTKFKADNIVDLFADRDKSMPIHEWPLHRLNQLNVTLDYGFIYAGPLGTSNIPGAVPNSRDMSKKVVVFETFKNYGGPIIHVLNETGITWDCISPDSRYFPLVGRELLNLPRMTLSQINATGLKRKIPYKGADVFEDVPVSCTYNCTESVCLMGLEKPSYPEYMNRERDIYFGMILNDGINGGLSRGPILDEWVFPYIREDFNIYGNWRAPYKDRPQFKGRVPFNQLIDEFSRTKYTFIIPIDEGWSTSKIYEMVHLGCIPFLHPFYDSQRNVPIPKILRPKSPEEMIFNMIKLDDNPRFRNELLSYLYHCLLLDVYYNGTHIENLFKYGLENAENKK